MKSIFFISVVTLFSCHSTLTKNNYVIKTDAATQKVVDHIDSNLENKITDTLLKLPFIKKYDEQIVSISNHKHGVVFMLDTINKGNDIYVEAGYNDEIRWITNYQFYINTKTLEIKVYD